MTNSVSYALAIAGGMVFAFLLLTLYPTEKKVKSSELGYTDTLSSGIRLIPASCESNYFHVYAITSEAGQLGVRVPSDGVEYGGYSHGYGFCIRNTTGNYYFVPLNTIGELQNFFNASNRPYTTHVP